jgi:uncharacterized protein (TIGR02444 family)
MSSNTATLTSIPLWDYALAFYAKPQVAECCLQLQDAYDVNVNLVLWCLWLEARQIVLTPERLTAAIAAIERWDRDCVQVLRQLRRKMKMEFAQDLAVVASVREQIKQTELLAEKQEHLWLEAIVTEWPSEVNKIIAGKNLEFYLSALKVPQSNLEQALVVLIR